MANLIPGTNHFTYAQGRKSYTCGGDKYIQNNFYSDNIFGNNYRNNGCCGGGMGYGYGFGGYDFMGGYDFRCFNGGGFGWGGGYCGNSFGDKMLGWIMGINILSSVFKTDETSTNDAGTASNTKTKAATNAETAEDKGVKNIPFNNTDKILQPSERIDYNDSTYTLITKRQDKAKLAYIEELTFDSNNNVIKEVRKYASSDGTPKAPITTNYSYEYDKDNNILSMTTENEKYKIVSTEPLNGSLWGKNVHVDKTTGKIFESYNQITDKGTRIYTELHADYQVTQYFDSKNKWKSTDIKNADGYLVCSAKFHRAILGIAGKDVGSYTDAQGKKISAEEYWALYNKTTKAE